MRRHYGAEVTTTPDPRFGTVNVYPKEILDQVFAEEFKRAYLTVVK